MLKKKNRVLAIIMLAALLAALIFSYDYIIENVCHDCTGEECPVCMEIDMAVQTIINLKVLPVLPLIIVALCVFTRLYAAAEEAGCIRNTLITLKVELLN